MVELFNVPRHIHKKLQSTVNEYIINNRWSIHAGLKAIFASLLQHVNKVVILEDDKDDALIWKHTTSGELNLKDAFSFIYGNGQQKQCAKIIWTADIPPSKSFTVWRLIQ